MCGINFLLRWKGCTIVKIDLTLGGLHRGEILMLPWGGLQEKHAMQRGIWVPT
jgi:hypothetical protein